MWRDIAILTNDAQRCKAFQAESQNVKSRWMCVPPDAWIQKRWEQEGVIPITKAECERIYLDLPGQSPNRTYAVWTEVKAWGTAAPACVENFWQRDNHLGNIKGGYPVQFNWTVPANLIGERCALRIRYNISTGDMSYWTDATSISPTTDARLNAIRPQKENRDPAQYPIWLTYGLNTTDVYASFQQKDQATDLRLSREYVLKNNPKVDIFGKLLDAPGTSPSNSKQGFIKLQLAINTAQYGRTFQDRTHYFAIRARPAVIPSDATILNLSVKGKRGNIVQVFPGVEYDFVPTRLMVQSGEWVHMQWTGSNTNPQNNAGEGLAGTDRSNIVPLREKTWNDGQLSTSPLTKGSFADYYPGRIDNTTWQFLGLSQSDLVQLGFLTPPGGGQFGGHMDQLDDAGTYFDLGPRKITAQGIYHYLCTRNNNFSNRNQAAKIVVSSASVTTGAVGWNGGTIIAKGSTVSMDQGTVSDVTLVTVSTANKDTPSGYGSTPSSDYVTVSFDASALAPLKYITVTLKSDTSLPSGLYDSSVYYAPSMNGPFTSMSNVNWNGDIASISTRTPGVYVADSTLNDGALAGIIIGSVIGLALLIGLGYFIYRKRANSMAASNNANI